MPAFDGDPFAVCDIEFGRHWNRKSQRLAALSLTGDFIFCEIELVVLQRKCEDGRWDRVEAVDRGERFERLLRRPWLPTQAVTIRFQNRLHVACGEGKLCLCTSVGGEKRAA